MKRTILPILTAAWLAGVVAPAGAAEWSLTSGNSTVILDDAVDAGFSPGVFSWLVDGTERINQQAFYYRVGTATPEYPLNGTEFDPDAHFEVTASNETPSSITLTFTRVGGAFSVAVNYELIGGTPGSGRATLHKRVTVDNASGAPLDFHFFSYSDYDLVTRPVNLDNAAIAGGRAFHSGFTSDTDRIGNGVTVVESSTLPPSRYGVDNAQFLGALANGETPYDLEAFAGPYPANGDTQFAFQWDLTIAADTPATFTITDEVYPAKALALGTSTGGTCVSYGQTFTTTYSVDNTRNPATAVGNVVLTEKPARDIAFVSATNGGSYDPVAGTVIWNLPSLAAGAQPQTVQATFMVNSIVDFTQESTLTSDRTFPANLGTRSVLCNHPPAITSSPVRNGTEARPYAYQVSAVDFDAGTTFGYSLETAPAGMTISASGLVSWTPDSSQLGAKPVRVAVSDGTLTTKQDFTVTVVAGPHGGDLNRDERMTLTDVILALKVTVGQVQPTPALLAEGDVHPLENGRPAPDGKINVNDAILILRKVLGLTTW